MLLRILGALALVSTTGCALLHPPGSHQQELVKMQTRILQLEQAVKSKPGTMSQKNLARLQTTVNRLERQLRVLNGQVDAVKAGHGVASSGDQSSADLANLQLRISQLEGQQKDFILELESLGSRGASSQSKNVAKNLAQLRKLYKQKKYKQVVNSERSVRKAVSSSQKMEFNYLLAESHFELGDMKSAALKYHEYLESNPKGQAFAHAKLRMGDCFRQLGDLDTAKIYYREVVDYDSKMNEAKIAQKRLKQFF